MLTDIPTWAIRAAKTTIPNIDSVWPIVRTPARESKGIQGIYQWHSPNESRIHLIQGVVMNTESGIICPYQPPLAVTRPRLETKL